jgi:multidrug efflux pump subunit AcrA (membrane-fusion protein)
MRSKFCAAKGEGRISKNAWACWRHGFASLAIALVVFGGSTGPGFSESWWEKMMGKGAPANQPAPAVPAGAPKNEAPGTTKNPPPAVPNNAPPAVTGPAVPVALPKVRNVSEYIELTGNAASVNTVKLIARVEGYLEKIHFKDGELVRKDDLLFTIQQEQYKAQLTQAEAQVKATEAALFYAKTEVTRYTALQKKGAAAQVVVDNWNFQAKKQQPNSLRPRPKSISPSSTSAIRRCGRHSTGRWGSTLSIPAIPSAAPASKPFLRRSCSSIRSMSSPI